MLVVGGGGVARRARGRAATGREEDGLRPYDRGRWRWVGRGNGAAGGIFRRRAWGRGGRPADGVAQDGSVGLGGRASGVRGEQEGARGWGRAALDGVEL